MLSNHRSLLRPQRIILGLVALLVVGGLTAFAYTQHWFAAKTDDPPKKAEEKAKPAVLLHDAFGPNGIRLSQEAITNLQIHPVEAEAAIKARPLPPQFGTVNYDNDALFIIRPRFTGEVAELRQVRDPGHPPYEPTRAIRFGDKVKPGDVVAVLWCKELGEKKAALVDALVNLRLSEDLFERQKETYKDGALPLSTLRATEAKVKSDRNTASTAELTLTIWKLSEAEIQEVKDAARHILDSKDPHDPERARKWARVEVRVPQPPGVDPKRELTIIEKNTNFQDFVDPSRDPPLFRLADMSRLQVWAHPPEEYLPLMRDRLARFGPGAVRWEVRVQSDPPTTPALDLPVTQLTPSVQPNQKTPMAIGPLENTDGKYLVGQFLTVTLFVPPPDNVVEVPTDAVNQVESENVIFVQDSKKPDEFFLRRVVVVRAGKETTLIRSKLTPDDEKFSRAEKEKGRHPLRPLLPHEKVVTRGVIELTAALDDLVTSQEPK